MLALCWHAHTLAAFRVATSRVETKKTLPLQTTPTLSLRVKHKFELSISNITLHYITTSLTSISFFCLDFDRNTHGLVCLHFWLKTQKHLCFVASSPVSTCFLSNQTLQTTLELSWVGLSWVELSCLWLPFHAMADTRRYTPPNQFSQLSFTFFFIFSLFLILYAWFILIDFQIGYLLLLES